MLLDKTKFKLFDGNVFDKLEGFLSRIFFNVITLQENKRLKSDEDRLLNKKFISVCRSGNRDAFLEFCKKYMNVVSSWNEIPFEVRKNIRNVITAQNVEKAYFNRLIYQLEHKNDPKFLIGHVIMSQRGRKSKQDDQEIFPFQKFSVLDQHKKTFVLQNILTKKLVLVSEEQIHKKFVYPYARTCHSYQGNSIDDVLIVTGFHHLYNDMNWLYTAASRTTCFQNVWLIVDQKALDFRLDEYRFLQTKIDGYIEQDQKKGFVLDMSRYVDCRWIELELKNTNGKCTYCKDDLGRETFTLDRIQVNLPHYRSNSVVCCLHCNRKKAPVDKMSLRNRQN